MIFAVYGQIYQTGADSYELFATWAVLMLPFAWVARSPVLWLFWLLIVQVAVTLFMQQELGIGRWWIDQKYSFSVQVISGVCFTFLVLWEGFRARGTAWMQARWPARVVFTLLLIQLTLLMCLTIIDFMIDTSWLRVGSLTSYRDKVINIGSYLGIILVALVYYQYTARDLYVQAITSFSIGLVSIVWLASWLFVTLVDRFRFEDPPIFVLLLVAGVIFAESTLALFWLRRKQHAWANIK